jgi:tRNA 2-thiouridine synthesizing protein A
MSETLLDVKGMSCPLPVLRANRALRSMAPGERLRVLATDRAAIADFRAFCQETGHALVALSDESGVLSFVIRRRPDDPGAADPVSRDASPGDASPRDASPRDAGQPDVAPRGAKVRSGISRAVPGRKEI